jgi:hypothetical protein
VQLGVVGGLAAEVLRVQQKQQQQQQQQSRIHQQQSKAVSRQRGGAGHALLLLLVLVLVVQLTTRTISVAAPEHVRHQKLALAHVVLMQAGQTVSQQLLQQLMLAPLRLLLLLVVLLQPRLTRATMTMQHRLMLRCWRQMMQQRHQLEYVRKAAVTQHPHLVLQQQQQ